MKEYEIEIHKCKDEENRNITVSKHQDNFWWLNKTIGMQFHLRIDYCPFCGDKLLIEKQIKLKCILCRDPDNPKEFNKAVTKQDEHFLANRIRAHFIDDHNSNFNFISDEEVLMNVE